MGEEYKRNNNTMANRAEAVPNYGKGFPQEDDTGSHARGLSSTQRDTAETQERHSIVQQRHMSNTQRHSSKRHKRVLVSNLIHSELCQNGWPVLMQAWAGVCALCRNAGICIERLVRIFCLKSDYEMTMMKTTRKIISSFTLIIFDIRS